MDRVIYTMGTWSRCMLEGHVKENNITRFHTSAIIGGEKTKL